LRDYGIKPRVWGESGCEHEWGAEIEVNATNHVDKRRWNHTRNGRDEEQPIEKRVAWLRTEVAQAQWCQKCPAWFGSLGLEPTPELYVQHIVEVFREVWRVLRKDGTCYVNLGDSYSSGGRDSHGTRIGYKQASNRGTMEATGHRLPMPPGLKPKDLVGIPWRVAFALQADGWWLRSDIIWSKPNPMPESVRDRPTKSHEYIFLLSKQERYYFDQDAVREPYAPAGIERSEYGYNHAYRNQFIGSPTDKRFQSGKVLAASHKGSKLHTGKTGVNGNGRVSEAERTDNSNGRNIRSVWTVATQPFPEAHFATFPEALIKPCILAGCPPGGIVLDPFGGSCTTVKVAQDLGRRGVALDLKPEYLSMGKRRSAQQGMILE